MTPSSAVRSFAITVAIAIAIIGPKATGFTINRTNSTTSNNTVEIQTKNLSLDESYQLQVKNDLKKPNDEKIKQNVHKEDETTTHKVEREKNDTETTTIFEVKSAITQSPNKKPKKAEIISTTENTRIPTISSDTVEVFDSVEDTTNNKSNVKVSEITRTSSEQSRDNVTTQMYKNTETTTSKSYNEPQLVELSTVIDQIATSSEISDQTTQKSVTRHVSNNHKETITSSAETATESMETVVPIETSTWVPSVIEDNDITGVPTADVLPTSSETAFSSSIPGEELDLTTLISPTSPEFDKTETSTVNSITKTSEPLWRKYTSIIRKRITSSEDISTTTKTEDETMKAETSNIHMNFTKAYNVTPIPSLQDLRIDLLPNTNQSSTNGDMISEETVRTTVAIESTIPFLNTLENTEAKRTGTVETKRAGYLDYSEKTTPSSIILTEKNEDEGAIYSTTDVIGTTETENNNFKKAIGAESQSLMAEDAIKEELMKESMLNNNQDNVDRYGVENGVKPLSNEVRSSVGMEANAPEDSLSVQPINERTKTTLYTVSPNYKPMKKIDVQPAKPFVRDPDDNSWRNESISSLGIVFKPKNSSKSFKEVLKNKTQTELNNLQEKDTKGDLPDLRVRLEKITEVRKTKKKKMNKDGVEVYTDYEESNSAEANRSSKPESSSSGTGSEEISFTTSAPFSSQSESELTTPMTESTHLEANNVKTMNTQSLFQSLGLDPQTTQKPKKFYNIAEYYDTTDEYDADYITMSKLDLQKFTIPPRSKPTTVRRPQESWLTSSMQPYLPERKPTVQYFPPRRPQKVNVNHHDKDFERKINLYTLETPRIELQPPFVTIPNVGIATEKPETTTQRNLHPHSSPGLRPHARPDILGPSDTRTTVKPSDFTMYTPADLNKNYYLTSPPRAPAPHDAFVFHDVGSLNRGSYVIKHYKDLLTAAGDDDDDDGRPPYVPFTEMPPAPADDAEKAPARGQNDYDDEPHFRKEVLNRFVDNFNQNSERFKVDFPILYNNSVVHRTFEDSGKVASSQAFLKRQYAGEGAATRASGGGGGGGGGRPCEPACDVTVELSPAYELHYYVPDQEEKEVRGEGAAPPPPPHYRLAL